MVEEKLRNLNQALGKYSYSDSTKEALFRCPFCKHKKKKLSINIEIDVYKCWVCSESGNNFYKLFLRSGTNKERAKLLSRPFRKSFFKKKYNEKVELITLPKEYLFVLDHKDTVLGRSYYNYLKSRGVTDEDIFINKIGFCVEGDYSGKLILPSFDKKGLCNFFVARSVRKSGWKYSNPSCTRNYKNQIIFNELNIDWNSPVILVEGYFDLIKAGTYNVFPLLGNSIDHESLLVHRVLENDTPLYVCLDSDAKKQSAKLINFLQSYGIIVYNVDIGHFKDPGEMGKKDFELAMKNASFIDDDEFYIKQMISSL